MKVVISQPMYFPWVGLLEQIKISGSFVHYDDVQFTRGFYNRVQVKTNGGMKWMTIPLRDLHQGQLLNEAEPDEREPWRDRHRALLQQNYAQSPFKEEMLALVDRVFSQPSTTLADMARSSTMAIAEYFDLTQASHFSISSELGIPGSSSQRLLDICRNLGAETYVTGHGARNYLDHDLFERSGVIVEYMDYQCTPYQQLYGAFTPYVTSLDLIANCGRDGAKFIRSGTRHWKSFINES